MIMQRNILNIVISKSLLLDNFFAALEAFHKARHCECRNTEQ